LTIKKTNYFKHIVIKILHITILLFAWKGTYGVVLKVREKSSDNIFAAKHIR